MAYILYQHLNTQNGKVYIGITNNHKRRWRNNGIEYTSKSNLPFSNAIKKYGWSSFNTTILAYDLTYTEACIAEKQCIKLKQSNDNKYGYNVAEGGNGGRIYRTHPRGMLGKQHTPASKAKIAKYFLNNNHMCKGFWDQDGYQHPRGILGKTHTSDTRQRIRQTCLDNKINHKSVEIHYPNGDIVKCSSRESAAAELNTCSTSSLFLRLLKTGEELKITHVNQHTKKWLPLEGLRIVDTSKENTEVN